ncbi:MAG: glutathione S-transferase [Gammaproteobacteria bacterium]|nr:glutathione S-transferase [Gammaproteobacteria bacterium]|tara:strand:+ start:945 stop:2063 length:1119 start_codon:yes stop_codon:yes gene_type:complete
MNEIVLYGSPLSLYTGRARSYLIKAGLTYRETTPTTEHTRDIVIPKAGGRASVPTIETPEGEVIRDGAAIVDHYENMNGHLFSPVTPKQRILSRLFDVIGAEGMLRPAMHYRWNFDDKNLEFLRFHFQSMMPRGPNREEKADAAANQMRAACMAFGAVPVTFELVETLYLELLQKLNLHFADQPYLLGGKPCVGDFGMIAPFYGHLGRDPKPLSLMQKHAVRLFRWVERMNRPELDLGEFEIQDAEYLPDDDVPETLIKLLKHIAIDFVPETKAAAHCINDWLDSQKDLTPGTPLLRGVGLGSFEVHGTTINALAQPYRFYLLKRVQDEYASLDDQSKKGVAGMLSACDMKAVLDLKLTRGIGRENNLEVWL